LALAVVAELEPSKPATVTGKSPQRVAVVAVVDQSQLAMTFTLVTSQQYLSMSQVAVLAVLRIHSLRRLVQARTLTLIQQMLALPEAAMQHSVLIFHAHQEAAAAGV